MATLNGVPFRKMLVPTSRHVLKCPYLMKPKKITVHNTDNQVSADAEIRYMINNSAPTSYHVGVDEKEAVQGLLYNRNGWHAGDGVNGYGNRNTIGVEICRNYDRSRGTTNLLEPLKSYFDKAMQNAVKVIAKICVDEGIVANFDNIKQHHDWSGKHCPSKIRNDGSWVWFVKAIIAEYNRLLEKKEPVVIPAPATKVASVKVTKTNTYTGGSIVDYLNSIGVDSSAGNRRKLAKEYGVNNYDLSGAKNLELLNKMRVGKPVDKPAAKPAPAATKPKAQPKNTVYLPASSKTWRTYKLNVEPVKKNSDWSLTPSRYGGLTYEILGRPYHNVVTIMTGRGKRNIYVGPETGAIIK